MSQAVSLALILLGQNRLFPRPSWIWRADARRSHIRDPDRS